MLSEAFRWRTETTIKMVITGATGNDYYVTEVTHGLNMEKFDFGDDGVEFINNNVEAAKGKCPDGQWEADYPKVSNVVGTGKGTELKLYLKTNQSGGEVYYVIHKTSDNLSAPSSTDIKTTNTGIKTLNNADEEIVVHITSDLTDSTDYKVYFLLRTLYQTQTWEV